MRAGWNHGVKRDTQRDLSIDAQTCQTREEHYFNDFDELVDAALAGEDGLAQQQLSDHATS